MQTKHFLRVIFIFVVLVNSVFISAVLASDGEHGDAPPHWTYEEAAHWSDNYPDCGLTHQSPIAVSGASSENLPDIHFNYHPSMLQLQNNGHTVQANYEAGSSITLDGVEYVLQQFHFHHQSEHEINGMFYPLEVHFVHENAVGDRAVVGVVFSAQAEDNAAYAEVFNRLPRLAESGLYQYLNVSINAAEMLPEDHQYIGYDGSLTTPPCTQNVRWLVMPTPVLLSTVQLEAFSALYSNNARPLQAENDRVPVLDSGADG